MGKTTFKALVAAALVGATALVFAVPAEAGRGWYGGRHVYHHHRHHGGGNAWGAGLLGFGVGALVGSALTPREVYVAPPPAPVYAAPVAYGPEPWTPDWYSYCYSRYQTFNPNTGTFIGYDGLQHFCR